MAVGTLMAGAVFTLGAGSVAPVHIHSLMDFSGTVRSSPLARLCADRGRDEIYVLESNGVKVFNAFGMEVFRFEYDADLGAVRDIAVDAGGDIFLLCDRPGNGDGRDPYIARCNYRGEPLEEIGLKGLPGHAKELSPDTLALRADRFVLASQDRMKAAEFRRDGSFERSWDLAEIAGLAGQDRASAGLGGFSVGGDGSLFFTIPSAFRAYVVAPDGTVRAFGRPGSAPGMFGIVWGIVRGEDGTIWVADRLRAVIIGFDADLRLVTEIGGGAGQPNYLDGPANLLVGAAGKLYVTQVGGRGISVFATRPS